MVLRDAHLHALVDHGRHIHRPPRPVPYHHSLPALLQLPRRLPQESGTSPTIAIRAQNNTPSFAHTGRQIPAKQSPQYWRLFTTFVYFGPLNFNLIFHIFFIQRYARMLEESAVSPAHFSWMLAYAATTIVSLAPLFSAAFLGSTLSSTLVYIWSRKHPDMQLSLLGLFVFKAPWLPWIMIALSVVLHGQWPKDELCGMVVGHIYYFFNDIYPAAHNGSRPLDPPAWWRRLFEREPLAPVTDGAVDRDVAAVAAPQVQ